MKFLIFQKQVLGPPPTPEQLSLNIQALEASAAIFQELKKKGKVESYYGVSGIPSGFAVVDVGSHDELNELLVDLPITMFGQIELYPLITIESLIKNNEKNDSAVAQMSPNQAGQPFVSSINQ